MKTPAFLSVLMSTAMLTVFVACDKTKENTPDNKPSGQDSTQVVPVEDEFHRMMLLEQFTSERCVNCPGGVKQIEDYLTTHKNVIWLAHHAGYAADQWTITESNSIVRLLGVQGAPAIALNRSKMTTSEMVDGYNLHPYYLSFLTNTPGSEASASIHISNTIASDTLHIHVEGKLKADAPKNMLLTVAIKESGLHGGQSDPNTLAGSWEDYIHSDVIRTFVSAVGGDPVVAQKDAYGVDYSFILNQDWVADNCMVVAFLTDDKSLNVVQAAEKPVVDGTKGGADLPHGGVTPKPVPEGYPEGQYTIADFLKADTINFQHAQAFHNNLTNGLREWHIMAWTTLQTYGSGQNVHIPFADIVFFTDANQAQVPNDGAFRFALARTISDIQPATAWAGYCDLEAQQIIGSEVELVNKASFEAGQIIPGSNARWLIADGTITFAQTGFRIDATSSTGKPIHLQFSGAYQY